MFSPGRSHEFTIDQFRRAAAGEEPIRGEVIAANRGLAVRAAETWARRNPEMHINDIVQAGSIGLIRAVDRFDPDRGYKFSTYAMWWINKEIRLEIAYEIAAGRATRTEAQQFMAGRLPEDRRTAYRAATDPHQCIYEPRGEDSVPLIESIVDDEGDHHEAAEIRADFERVIDVAIEECSDDQFTALMMRFGAVFFEPSSYESIAKEMGLGSPAQAKVLVEESAAVVRKAMGC